MRKLLFAALLALSVFPAIGSPSPQDPPTSYQEFVQAHEPWNRFAEIKLKDGRVLVAKNPNKQNPFANKAACVADLEADTRTIYIWLLQQGVDIEQVDVIVSCEPTEGQGI